MALYQIRGHGPEGDDFGLTLVEADDPRTALAKFLHGRVVYDAIVTELRGDGTARAEYEGEKYRAVLVPETRAA